MLRDNSVLSFIPLHIRRTTKVKLLSTVSLNKKKKRTKNEKDLQYITQSKTLLSFVFLCPKELKKGRENF